MKHLRRFASFLWHRSPDLCLAGRRTQVRRPVPLLLFTLLAGQLSAATVADCTALTRHGKLDEARKCYSSLLNSSDAYVRAEGLWGLERYQDASDQFKLAAEEQKKNSNLRVRWGRLFLERYTTGEAGKLFQEALEIDDKNAGA